MFKIVVQLVANNVMRVVIGHFSSACRSRRTPRPRNPATASNRNVHDLEIHDYPPGASPATEMPHDPLHEYPEYCIEGLNYSSQFKR